MDLMRWHEKHGAQCQPWAASSVNASRCYCCPCFLFITMGVSIAAKNKTVYWKGNMFTSICLQRGVTGGKGAICSDCNVRIHSHSRELSTLLIELTESSASSRATVFWRTQSDRMVSRKSFSASCGSCLLKEALLFWQLTSHMQKAVGSKLELTRFWISVHISLQFQLCM